MIAEKPFATWYVVAVKTGAEREAAMHLVRQKFDAYCPMMFTDRRGKPTREVEPMFPGYIFMSPPAAERDEDRPCDFSKVESTRGVYRLVRFGDYVPTMPPGAVERMQEAETAEGVHGEPRDWKPGDRVRVTAGPFEGYEALVQAKTSEERVRILMDVLGRGTLTTVPEWQLEPVDHD